MRKAGWLALLYAGPAVLLLAFYLVYPSIETFRLSLYDSRSAEFVGLENYAYALTAPEMLSSFRNNLLWLVLFTFFVVMGGLVIAVILDRVRYESLAKAVVFLPQAISFVGAGVIWKFIYDYRPQVGLLNAIITGVDSDAEAIGWLVNSDIATFSLIAVAVWMWTGFSMVVLSVALKGIPQEIVDAARIDGANEWQLFWQVTIPMISSTIAVVTTTLVIIVLKVFDLIYVMTNGNFNTNVIANQMYKELYINRNNGRASAIAVVLLMAIVPVMLVNIRRFQEQEARR
jgi:alpha-glucoside transport system permease protein